ncbi:MAG: glycosyl hydrolase family 18 protein [Myxococcota bacterium]
MASGVRSGWLGLVLVAVSTASVARASPIAIPDAPRPRGHRDLMAEPPVRPAPPARRAMARARTPSRTAARVPGPIVRREVYGYLPYWEMGYEVPHWELLTTVAWFAVGLDGRGEAVEWNGWGGAGAGDLVAEAHAHGVRAVVTVTLFDGEAIGALLADPERRARAVETCLTLLAVHEADGINVDFEFVPKAARDDFVAFMSELKTAVDGAVDDGEGHVTFAGPAVDWSGAYDYDELLAASDGAMVMAYGYHWEGGDPGPVAPLHGGGKWGVYSVAWTIQDYLTWGGVEHRDKIIVGLPWYGRAWAVADESVPGVALGDGAAIVYEDAAPEAEAWGPLWDDDADVPYYHREDDGGLVQVWYDDQASFGLKLAHIDDEDLGGVGIWALGYDGAREDYWAEIADQWGGEVRDPEPPDDPEPGTPEVAAPRLGAGHVASVAHQRTRGGGGCAGGGGGGAAGLALLALTLLGAARRRGTTTRDPG